MAKFCSNCGAGLDEAAKFCMSCGTPVASAPVAAAAPSPAPEPQPAPQPEPVQYAQPEPVPPSPPPMQAPQPQYMPQQPAQPFPQAPQQPYPQPQSYAPAPDAQPKKKGKKGLVIALVVILVIVGGIAAIIAGAAGAVGKAAKADYYELGNDRIPSVKFALGEKRKVSGVNTSISNGTTMKEYKYNEPGRDQAQEMIAYLNYLREKNGFLILNDENFNPPDAWCKIGRNSVDAGYEIIVQIEYSPTGYIITLVKEPGEITPNTDEPVEPANFPGDPYSEMPVDPPSNYEGQEMWIGQFDTADAGPHVMVFYFNDDGTFLITIQYADYPEENLDLYGSYTMRGGTLNLTDVMNNQGDEYNDIEYLYALSGNTMTLDDEDVFWRVADEDRPDVLTDPFIPYPYTSFSAR